ncbi:hypothetical protein ACSD7O_19015 [Methylorubrum extorquens]|uniref:hypothetical protein n=1 Tax=Methylorubrum extorquens TaxID=408 RepID=UPI003F60E128
MSEGPTPVPTYWSRARVEAEVARGFPRFLAETRLPPSPSFDASAPRPALVPLAPLAPEPRPAVAAVRPVPPAPRPAPRLPRAAAPIQETLL